MTCNSIYKYTIIIQKKGEFLLEYEYHSMNDI